MHKNATGRQFSRCRPRPLCNILTYTVSAATVSLDTMVVHKVVVVVKMITCRETLSKVPMDC